MDEIEYGFYENHKFVLKAVKWQEVDDFHKGIFESIKKIEEIGKQIIEDYE